MNAQAYIQSGILQDYCLGLLSPPEMQAVEQYAAAWPEVRAELEACRLALEQYVHALALPVPGSVKDKALHLINELTGKGNEIK